MTPATIALWILATLIIDVGYGLLVYFTSPKRSVNQQFLLLTIAIGAWLCAVHSALVATSAESARSAIALASAASNFIPASFCLLRLAIKRPEESWLKNIARLRWMLLANIAWVAACLTPQFIAGVHLAPSAVAEPTYGVLFPLWNLYFALLLIITVGSLLRDLRILQGVARVELQFLLLGAGTSCLTAMILAILVPNLTGSSQSAPLAPVSVIILNAIIGYGIVTRRIMGVAVILQKLTAYGLLAIYLCGIHTLVLFISQRLMGTVQEPWRHHLPPLLAALVTAFSVIPAHVWFLKLALRLFGNSGAPNIAAMVQKAGAILSSITTLDDLFLRFVPLVKQSLGAESVVVYLATTNGYARNYPVQTNASSPHLGSNDPLARTLRANRTPIVAELVSRARPTPDMVAAARQLTEFGAKVGMGIYSKEELTGIILLGARQSGRIYGASEQEALHILCNQLGVAVDNAKLYTQAQNSRLYNDILVDSLVSGVIAVGGDHKITVLNREAQRILRLPAVSALTRELNVLPTTLRDVLQQTLDSGKGVEEHEVALALSPDETVHVRLGSAIFRGHTGEILGALLVLHDITAIKQLQEQIRRSDRLASMGTLSAGMAHEIKNPLVTIRTFTQLLPERYDDPEFRGTFLSLVADEVKRIDGIVNQLLRFSRPAKPKLDVMHVHAALEDSLRLVHEEFRRKNIAVVRDFADMADVIVGDSGLLGQAFVNFFLNSQEAMHDGGTLTVSTRGVSIQRRPRAWGEAATTQQSVRIEIADTGEGIKEADVVRIFDPFFTTKSQGTGLGLTVSHGIIQDHGGVINVKSVVGQGTTLIIDLPCSSQKEPYE